MELRINRVRINRARPVNKFEQDHVVGEFPCGEGSQVSMWWGVPCDLETPYVNRQINRQPYMTENITFRKLTMRGVIIAVKSLTIMEVSVSATTGSNCNFLNVENFQICCVLNCILKLEKINSLN